MYVAIRVALHDEHGLWYTLTVKIIYLNAWGELMRDELVDYVKDQARDTDIFCFQEATDEMKQRCKGALHGYKEISDYKFVSEKDYFPQSIFIKNDIEVLSSGTLLDKDDRSYGLAIYAEVKIGDCSLYVCNIHGTARPDDKQDSPARLRQSEELIEYFRSIDKPTMIGGDFNINLNTDSINMFEHSGYRNLIKEFGIATTRNHLAWDRFEIKMYYSDYVFLNDKIQLKNFSVPDIKVSDHLPMILEIEV